MYIKKWLIATAIRTGRTMAQAAAATIGATALITDVNWQIVLSATVMAGIGCVLTCIASLPEAKIETTLDAEEADATRDDVETKATEITPETEAKVAAQESAEIEAAKKEAEDNE